VAVRLSDLKIHVTAPQISLFRPENAYFLNNTTSVSLGNLWHGWVPISRIVIVGGAVVWLVVAALLLAEWIWASPFVVRVDGVIDGVTDAGLAYHYIVDGVRYDKVEPSRFYSSAFAAGGVPNPVVYLSFAPSQSKLSGNVESVDLFTLIAALVFVASLPVGMHVGLREHHRLVRIRDGATHLLDGQITFEYMAMKGVVSYAYQAVSPVTGKQIGGVVQAGRLSPQYGRIGKGAAVVVLYRDDKHHMIL
jgi:hypothetical protein